MTVEIKNLQRRYPIDRRSIREKAERILSLCGLGDVELSLLFVNNQRMRELNRRYRGVDKPTDVLAFPMIEDRETGMSGHKGEKEIPSSHKGEDIEAIPHRGDLSRAPVDEGTKPKLIGDVVISMEKTYSQAREHGHPPSRELSILLTHGILHLIGYDHETSSREKMRMRRKENFILSRL